MGDSLDFVDLGSFNVSSFGRGMVAEHTCAISTADQVKCWGRNDKYQLGLGDTETRGNKGGQMGDFLLILNLIATQSPSTEPTIEPTNELSNGPTFRETTSSTLQPTHHPSLDPSLLPSIPPSGIPPTVSPTMCLDLPSYDSNDGIDEYENPNIYIPRNITNDSNQYIASSTNGISFNSTAIFCNNTLSDLCYIGCLVDQICLNVYVEPIHDDVVELFVECQGIESCHFMNMEVDQQSIRKVTVICKDHLSCRDSNISIHSADSNHTLEFNLLCQAHESCEGLSVQTDHAPSMLLTVELDTGIP